MEFLCKPGSIFKNAYGKVAGIVEQKELEEGSEEICEMIDFKYFKEGLMLHRKALYFEKRLSNYLKILGVAI